jgi:hypothetical protein
VARHGGAGKACARKCQSRGLSGAGWRVAVTCVYLVEPVGCCATGVVHGPAGTGKTYAVQAALETLARDSSSSGVRVTACTLAFPARPTMQPPADEALGSALSRVEHLGEAGPRAAWIRCSGLSQATTPVAPAT